MSRRHWERQASNWSAWARSASDAYWRFAPAFFDLVPPPKGRTLEVGCGEGRVTRDLIARGHHVVAVDITEALLRTAYESDDQGGYVRCDAAQLPFAPESFDLAVFYNSLMDIDEMPGSLDEAARVLRPGGHLCACVTHPIPDAGAFAAHDGDAPFVIEGSYLGPRRWLEIPVEREGLQMDFSGWAYSLEAYSLALEHAGFMIEALREPPYPSSEESDRRWRRIPLFLMWRAVKA